MGDSLAYNPDALPTRVQSAISQMPEEDELTIRSRDDVECVKDALDEPINDVLSPATKLKLGASWKKASIDSSLDAVASGLESAVSEWLGPKMLDLSGLITGLDVHDSREPADGSLMPSAT